MHVGMWGIHSHRAVGMVILFPIGVDGLFALSEDRSHKHGRADEEAVSTVSFSCAKSKSARKRGWCHRANRLNPASKRLLTIARNHN